MHEPELGHLLVLGAWTAIVGVRVDADAAARCEDTCDLDVARVHETDEVLYYLVYAVLVEIAVIAEAEEVELEALRLHHPHVWDIRDAYLGEVGLTRDGAETGELRAVETHPVVVLLMAVLEGFQDFWSIAEGVVGFIAEVG